MREILRIVIGNICITSAYAFITVPRHVVNFHDSACVSSSGYQCHNQLCYGSAVGNLSVFPGKSIFDEVIAQQYLLYGHVQQFSRNRL